MMTQEHAAARRWLRRDGAARYMGCSLRHVDQLIADGHLPVSRSGRLVRIDVADIDAYMAANRSTAV